MKTHENTMKTIAFFHNLSTIIMIFVMHIYKGGYYV